MATPSRHPPASFLLSTSRRGEDVAEGGRQKPSPSTPWYGDRGACCQQNPEPAQLWKGPAAVRYQGPGAIWEGRSPHVRT